VFTARYALSSYIKQTRFVFKGLIKVQEHFYIYLFDLCSAVIAQIITILISNPLLLLPSSSALHLFWDSVTEHFLLRYVLAMYAPQVNWYGITSQGCFSNLKTGHFVFWDGTPCVLVDRHRLFGEQCSSIGLGGKDRSRGCQRGSLRRWF
jgi:hypothetical protein